MELPVNQTSPDPYNRQKIPCSRAKPSLRGLASIAEQGKAYHRLPSSVQEELELLK